MEAETTVEPIVPPALPLSTEIRRQLEQKIAFCFSKLFYFEVVLVAGEGDFSSTTERDAAPKPAPLGWDILPPLHLDVGMLPQTILVPASDGSIWGDLHPFIALQVNLANGYENLPCVERLILTHRFGLKRSPEEIASTLGCSRTQVYIWLSRAIGTPARSGN